jgi:superfamily II DNA or RNA helicase
LRFADKIEPERWYDRLLAAVTIDHEYDPEKAKNQLIIDLLRAANNKLMDLRQSNPRAGGLLITGSKDAARKLKALLRQVTGHDAILVLEDIEKTSELIDAFRDGDSPWIISVNMVTEGVDIPRLRVCAYLSTKTAWLYVMQVIGRIVRDPPGQSYFFYFPDPRLEKIVAQIEKEMEVWLRKKRPGDAPPQSDFEKIIELNKATGEQWAGLVAGEPVTSAEMAAVEAMRHAMPDLDDTDYLTLLKMARMSNTAKQQRQQEPPPSSHAGMSYSEIRFELRGRIQKGVGRLNKLRGLLHNDIHHALNRAAGVRGKDDASREQLEHMLALIQEWIATAEHENGNHRQS